MDKNQARLDVCNGTSTARPNLKFLGWLEKGLGSELKGSPVNANLGRK